MEYRKRNIRTDTENRENAGIACPARGENGECFPQGGFCVYTWNGKADDYPLIRMRCRDTCKAYMKGKEDAEKEMMAYLVDRLAERGHQGSREAQAEEDAGRSCDTGRLHNGTGNGPEDITDMPAAGDAGGQEGSDGTPEEAGRDAYTGSRSEGEDLRAAGKRLYDTLVSGAAAAASLAEDVKKRIEKEKEKRIKQQLAEAADSALKKVSEEIRRREKEGKEE